MKQEFEKWLKGIAKMTKKSDGESYSEDAITKYLEAIDFVKKNYNYDLYEYNDTNELTAIKNKLLSDNKFVENNNIEHDIYIKSIDLYIKFIKINKKTNNVSKYTWSPIFKKIAKKLLEYKNKREELVDLMYEILIENGQLNDEESGYNLDSYKGKRCRYDDFDPFSFMNRMAMSTFEKRTNFIRLFIKKTGIKCDVPKDYYGLPSVNNQFTCFISFKDSRNPNDIDDFWEFFEVALKYIDDKSYEEQFIFLYDKIMLKPRCNFYVTAALFRIDTNFYFSLDSVNRKYLNKIMKLDINECPDGKKYVDILKEIKNYISQSNEYTSLVDFSSRAWEDSNTIVKFTKSWTYNPGDNAFDWDYCYENGVMTLKYDEIGDLKKYKNKKELIDNVVSLYGSNSTNVKCAIDDFFNNIKKDDVIICKNNNNILLGYGIVLDDKYIFDDSREKNKHIRHVKWLCRGNWVIPTNLLVAKKTLTDITKYDDFANKLLKIMNNNYDLKDVLTIALLNIHSKTEDSYISLNDIYSEVESIRHIPNPNNGASIRACLEKNCRESTVFSGTELFISKEIGSGLYQSIYYSKINHYYCPINYEDFNNFQNGVKVSFKKINTMKVGDYLYLCVGNQNKDILSGIYAVAEIIELQDNEVLCKIKISSNGLMLAPRKIFEEHVNVLRSINLFKDGYKILSYILGSNEEVTLNNTISEIEEIEEKEDLLSKNIIYYGGPGCGKSFKVKQLYCKNRELYERVTFYSDYTNSEFVGQLIPVKKDNELSYEIEPGPFTKALEKALNNSNKNVYLIIEEINRGNAAAIFGDIFQLLDRSKSEENYGESEFDITNYIIEQYIKDKLKRSDYSKIVIPANLSIIATMNTSDQNVYILDSAFKRRFEMEYISNKFDNSSYDQKIANLLVPMKKLEITWKKFIQQINNAILEENSFGVNSEDKQIGKYFIEASYLLTKDKYEKNNYELESKKFAEKVLSYLWEDISKLNRKNWFKHDLKSFEDVVDIFVKEGIDVFGENIKIRLDSINKESNEENV